MTYLFLGNIYCNDLLICGKYLSISRWAGVSRYEAIYVYRSSQSSCRINFQLEMNEARQDAEKPTKKPPKLAASLAKN
jgi:hypothetical protein